MNNFCRHTTIVLLLILPCLIGNPLKAQSAKKVAAAYMEKYNKHVIDPELSKELMSQPAKDVIKAFESYSKDSLPRIRGCAYRMIAKAGTSSEDKKEREQAIKILVQGINDKDAGVTGNVIDYLKDFKPADFNPEQRYIISMKVKEQPAPRNISELVLLTGYIGIDELIYNYKHMLADSVPEKAKTAWCMKLAMARLGDEEAGNEVISKIKSLKLNDKVAFDIYPNLAYVRTKKAFDILLEAILSDSKDCNSANPDKEAPIICAFRIIEYTAQYIIDFPVKTDEFGDPQIDDYAATLAEVREWITTNKENYKLITDIY